MTSLCAVHILLHFINEHLLGNDCSFVYNKIWPNDETSTTDNDLPSKSKRKGQNEIIVSDKWSYQRRIECLERDMETLKNGLEREIETLKNEIKSLRNVCEY